jgi:multidrug efflux system membrane fusion protein
MAARFFRPSRLIAAALVVGAALWIASGQFGGGAVEQKSTEVSAAAAEAVQVPIQKVAVTTAIPEQHSRTILLSCVTKADKRASAVARGGGVIIDLSVSRGSTVIAGQVVALISDEGRAASVEQAQALLDQRTAEYEANKALIDRGDAPRNNLAALESAMAAARAALAGAQAEADRSVVKAPINGVVDSVPMQVGQAVQAGAEIAVVIAPDPMLAVGAVSEARRSSIEKGQSADIRFIDGSKVPAAIDFVSVSADKATRTYAVEARMANKDSAIGDGVTCEMAVTLAPIEATAIPRSALVFSDEGHLGIRAAGADDKAHFMPVDIVEDARDVVWVTGVAGAVRVIVVGQDFVKEGDPVEAVSAADAGTPAAKEPPA